MSDCISMYLDSEDDKSVMSQEATYTPSDSLQDKTCSVDTVTIEDEGPDDR